MKNSDTLAQCGLSLWLSSKGGWPHDFSIRLC
jgi:hypothetical protein